MSKRWEIFHISEASLLAFYRVWCNASLPRSLRPMIHDVQLNHLPYLYHTVKQKCHKGAGTAESPMKTCENAEHACYRNIASFCLIPARKSFKAIGRGMSGILIECCWFWMAATWTEHGRRRYPFPMDEIKPRRYPGRCKCCGVHMTRPSKYTGDAPQAFEGVDAEFAVRCINLCIERMKCNKEVGSNVRSITVLRKTVATTMPGGHVIAEYFDRVVF